MYMLHVKKSVIQQHHCKLRTFSEFSSSISGHYLASAELSEVTEES